MLTTVLLIVAGLIALSGVFVVTKSTLITNAEASPIVKNDHQVDGGKVVTVMGTVAIADGDFDADGDEVRLCRLPSNATIKTIELANDSLDAGTDALVNVGLLEPDGTIADEDAYASAITQFQSATAMTRVENEARNINTVGQKVYEDAGDSEGDFGHYILALFQTAAVTTDAAGDISFIVEYVIGT